MERGFIYMLVIANVSLGFFLFYGGLSRLGLFDYRHFIKKQEKKDSVYHGKKRN